MNNGRHFKVKELGNGTGNYDFDYLVHGVRRGCEDFEVVQDKVEPLDPGPAE
ncbi:MAG: hypothetical protein KAY24_15650 [Candidatus Eisenbacteria sp.]|nr:hypothetical protein [Candidatus Eisenbacteria bacterium]